MSFAALIFLTTIVAQAGTPAPKPASTPPAAAGAPHMCMDYPVGAMQTLAEGTTTVAFKITETGSVTDASVKTSSGSPDLDSASVACTKTWQYRPATQNGAPVAVPWQVAVKWQVHPTPPFDAVSAVAYQCVQSSDAGRNEMSEAKLHTVVRVHFKNGDIAGVSVVGSSGDSNLDRRVADCYGRVAPAVTASIQGEMYQALTPIPAAVP